jgi:serine/threonine protein kinase
VGINDDTKEKVAVKIIEKACLMRRMHANIGGDLGSMIEGVKKEIIMLRRFSGRHLNIIRLIDVIETWDSVCTIMEYCSGGEYFDLIAKRGRIPE